MPIDSKKSPPRVRSNERPRGGWEPRYEEVDEAAASAIADDACRASLLVTITAAFDSLSGEWKSAFCIPHRRSNQPVRDRQSKADIRTDKELARS